MKEYLKEEMVNIVFLMHLFRCTFRAVHPFYVNLLLLTIVCSDGQSIDEGIEGNLAKLVKKTAKKNMQAKRWQTVNGSRHVVWKNLLELN